MLFLAIAVLYLIGLILVTWMLTEAVLLGGRCYRWVRYSWPSRYRSWQLKRSVNELIRRFESDRARPVSFGQLRFTRKER